MIISFITTLDIPARTPRSEIRALSVRQPWAELILLGHKTIEVRSQRTNIRERVHIYAGRNKIEAEEEARIAAKFGIDVDGLPRGVLVETVEILGYRPWRRATARQRASRSTRRQASMPGCWSDQSGVRILRRQTGSDVAIWE
jgi:hypothetical protein